MFELKERKETDRDNSFPVENLAEILSSLGKEDSLKIFHSAKDGIANSTEAIKKLQLTQKRYYTSLKRLLEAGLLQKRDNVYQHTTLGMMCFRLGEVLAEAVDYNEQLNLIDKVRQSKSLSLEDKEEVIRAVSRSTLTSFADLLNGGIKPVGIVSKFEDITAGVRRLLEKAEKEVYLATRYTDASVTESILDCLARGIEMHLLDGDKKNLSQKVQLIRLVFSHPRMIKLFYEIFRSPRVQTGYTDNLPYSFIVVDGKYVGIEIPKPGTDEFFIGLFFENRLLSTKLAEVYNQLARKAQEDPRKELSAKIYSQSGKAT